MDSPKVSVIVPVYNCRASVEGTLRSVFEQTLGPERVEVVAVDDGSTDGSGEELDRLAAVHDGLRVVHQANSGGPGGPRNTAVRHARGEYLFFLDADDRLGPEALERMCAMADEQGTDIVIGKYVGVGRGVARFEATVPRVSVDDPDFDVYGRSLTAHKLFRRDLVTDNGITFPEGILSGEDKVFTAHALLHSAGVSIIADYDCYYLVERDDGTSIMQTGGAPAGPYFAKAARPLVENVMSHRKPGPVRDRMLVRHFQRDVLHRFNGRFLAASDEAAQETESAVRALCDDYLTPAVLMRMPPRHRLLAHCARTGHSGLLREIVQAELDPGPVPVAVDKDRAYLLYPGFREPAAAIPDAYFDVTDRLRVERTLTGAGWDGDLLRVRGTAAVERVDDPARRVELVLRCKQTGEEHRLPAEHGGDGAFDAAVDMGAAASGSPLPAGTWDLHVAVTSDQMTKEGRFGADAAEGAGVPGARFVRTGDGTGALVTPFLTKGYGNVSFTVTPGTAGLEKLLGIDEIGWDGGARLRVRGHAAASPGSASLVRVGLRLERRGGSGERTGEVRQAAGADGLEFTAVVDSKGLAAGRWDVWLDLAVGDASARLRIPLATVPDVPAVACAPLGMRRASVYRTNGGNLAVHVVPGKVPSMARSAGRRLGRPRR